MDDANIREQLSQIFPQEDPVIIQRTVEQAKATRGEAVVDILTLCIELVLGRREAGRTTNAGFDQQDDDVVITSEKKAKPNKKRNVDIPVVYVGEERSFPLIDTKAATPTIHPTLPVNRIDLVSTEQTHVLPESNSDIDHKKLNRTCFRSHFLNQLLDVEELPKIPDIQTMENFQKWRQPVDSQQLPTLTSPAESSTFTRRESPHVKSSHVEKHISPISGNFFRNHLLDETGLNESQDDPERKGFKRNMQSFHDPQDTPKFTWRNSVITPPQSSRVCVKNPLKSPLVEQHHFPLTGQHKLTPILVPASSSNTPATSSTIPQQHPSVSGQPCVFTPLHPQASSTVPPTMSVLDSVKQMFPKVNEDFVKNLSQQGYDLNSIVDKLLERKDMQSSSPSMPKEEPAQKKIDYFKEYSQRVSSKCYEQGLCLLKNEFRRVAVIDIRKAMDICKGHYAPSRKLIEEALLAMGKEKTDRSNEQTPLSTPTNMASSTNASKKFVISRLITSKRTRVFVESVFVDDLQQEIEFVKEKAMLAEEQKNAIFAAHLNEEQYKSEGQLIECGCCFGEFPFEEIVQCSYGHLFCKECLHGYAKEVIFGSAIASVNLTCMEEGCDNKFPYSQLEKCLTKNEIEKYQGRLQEDCLAKADIPGFHQCPFCEFAAIIPEETKVFDCMNPSCGKQSCVECEEDWKDHFGLKCNEVEKKSQTNLRLSYEERMTLAKIRKCAKCSLTFTKSDGCNKMTCRCGATQCYVCRKPFINYDHFCRHPRDPGTKCQRCTACSLWTDPTEDDDLAVKQLEEEANAAKRKLAEEIQQDYKKQKVQ